MQEPMDISSIITQISSLPSDKFSPTQTGACEEAIAILSALQDEGIENLDRMKFIFQKNRKALVEELDREYPDPLTADELRQMDGMPIWCVMMGRRKRDAPLLEKWFILSVPQEKDENGAVRFWATEPTGEVLESDSYDTKWIAYKYKPESEPEPVLSPEATAALDELFSAGYEDNISDREYD